MGFRQKIASFLYGRYINYGIDRFTTVLLVLCVLLSIVNLFIGSLIIQLLETALFVFCIFRLLSRNIVKRQSENQRIVEFTNKFARVFNLQKRKFKERESHIYKTCPHCRVTLRLPRKPGRHNVNCPRCKNNFEVKVR